MIIKIFYLSIFLSGKFLFCFGKSPNKLNGGLEIIRSDMYNYHVSVRHKKHHVCSGGIISPSYVLTSANCIVLEKNKKMVVILSNLQILTDTTDKLNNDNTGNIHEVWYTFIHDQYDAVQFWVNDIALLQMVKPFIFTKTLSNIALPTTHLRALTRLKVTGWPESSDNSSSNNSAIYLQLLGVQAKSHSECIDLFPDFGLSFPFQSCATSYTEDAKFTNGDSGNPLNFNGRIPGLISVLTPKNSDAIVLTRVWPYTPWIKEMMKKYK